MAAASVDRRVILVAVAIPALVLLGFVLAAVPDDGGGGDDEVTTTVATDPPASTAPVAVDEAWNEALEDAVSPLSDAIPELSEAVTSWAAGEADDADVAEVLDRVEPVFAQVRADVEDLPEHPEDELAAPLVREMAQLYVLATDAHRLAVAEDGAVASQWDLLGRRLRVVADRIFDRARERTAVAFDPGEGVDLRLPAEVPDWTRFGLAVGRPLEPADTNVDELPRQREEHRESQPLPAWRTDVEALEVPGAATVRAALDAEDVQALGALARSLILAVEELRDVPVPDGDRARPDRLALAWLLRADAARAGQLALVGDVGATGTDGGELAARLLESSTSTALTAE